ncbi:winged helix DNA-binding domain-containing protein [Rhodococcus maanshanensis]|uniref:Winged helix DNA-binding domain-containing protein n=1 Tax=Rhodococcus maanshanensis TaxID=183556 RepID=A0A1H7TPB7_9NOCA|nr:winged helix DNA-binding domain-containing protein [Rhodococcus maanshanensis]SEL86528.1 Winged helix DNA-binding domain-containing protein [Rhodococcus maanshanensis]
MSAGTEVRRERLSRRALSRATLERQHLLRRTGDNALAVIGHLYGLQAQAPMAPYFALWARLKGFRPTDLSSLIENRDVVRIVVMRGTVHAVTAADALALRPWVQPIMDADMRTNTLHKNGLVGMDLAALADWSRATLEHTPLSMADLRPLLAERWPDRDPVALAHGVRNLLPLVQIPPRGIWGRSGQPVCTTLERWTDAPLSDPVPDEMILRYLAAYGPASAADAQAWSGLTRLGEVFDRLRPRLRVFVDEDGAELFDLPDAPRPDPAGSLPARILAPYDSVLLGHANRSRVLADEHRKVVFTANGIIKPTVMVGGQVAGFVTVTAKKRSAAVEIATFAPLAKGATSALEAEAQRLLKFAHPDADDNDVRFTAVR